MKKRLLLRICLGLLISFPFLSCEKQDPEPEEPALKLSNISPYSGYEGDTIIIYGEGFSATETENKVSFNDLEAAIITAAEEKLEVVVPDGATTGKISVTVQGQTLKSGLSFTVFPKPVIDGFSPLTAYEGEEITIKGSAFSEAITENKVFINGVAAKVESASPTELKVVVPEGVESGKVSVSVNGKTATSLESFTIKPDHWTRMADCKGNINHGGVSFSIGRNGYVTTGKDGSGTDASYLKEMWAYDPEFDTWTQKANFPGPARSSAVGFVIKDKAYVGSGESKDGTYLKDFWEYDPATDRWTQMAPLPGDARYGAVSFSLGGKGYVGTGFGESFLKDFWAYDPESDSWIQKADFGGGGRHHAVAFAVGEKGFVGTGYNPESYQKDFWAYDPESDSWDQKADFGGEERIQAVSFSIGEKGYVGTGTFDPWEKSDRYRAYLDANDFWEYNPAEDLWTRKANAKARGFGGISFSVGNKGYITIGFNSTKSSEFWEYNQE